MKPSAITKFNCIKKRPDRLIYKRCVNTVMHPPQTEFVIFSTKGVNEFGILKCHETLLDLRPDYSGKSLAIDHISTNSTDKGIGTDLINFAKNYSKTNGCNGHVVLKADPSIQSDKVPHLFYRKMGFSTLDEKLNAKMDKFISKNKNATIKDFACELMFYPPLEKPKASLFEKIVQLIKSL